MVRPLIFGLYALRLYRPLPLPPQEVGKKHRYKTRQSALSLSMMRQTGTFCKWR